MCGIFSSFSRDEAIHLAKANAYRGECSYSITGIDFTYKRDKKIPNLKYSVKEMGPFNISKLSNADFYICHIQAPTGVMKEAETIHPATLHSSSLFPYQSSNISDHVFMLWHNGIIKEYECDRLREKQKTDERWDTALLLNEIHESGLCLDNLSEINGSFACIARLWNGNFYVFRNDLAPMFRGPLSLSSVKTDLTPDRVKANRFYLVDFNHPVSLLHLDEIGRFKTKENPYYGLEDDND